MTHRSLPLHGASNPGEPGLGTTPGSFALVPDLGGPSSYASPDSPGMPQASALTAWDFLPSQWSRGSGVAVAPEGYRVRTQLEHARVGTITAEMRRVAEREGHLSAEQVRSEVAAGRLIIPANHLHLAAGLEPIGIGRACTTKINANLGASPISSSEGDELEKLRWAVHWGADAVMDLSTGGNLDACREAMVRCATAPVGTVPMYSMIVERRLEDLRVADILSQLRHQAAQGVDFFTIHAGLLREFVPLTERRVMGIVSRGGSLLANWMLLHGEQNPMYAHFDEICDILREHDVAFSLGDGLRPGCLADATDEAQLRELETLAELTERAWQRGCQVMIEGPGHVPFDQIEYNMKEQRRLCHGAPFYVLGPVVTDIFPGYDHITSCIGATAAAYHGASMLCYVTPREHLGLPRAQDVKQGCVAYKIAAHAADVALGIPGARRRDDAMSRARADLDWHSQFELAFDGELARVLHDEDTNGEQDYCSMCGHDWCAARINKTVKAMSCSPACKPACHSDLVDDREARRMVEQDSTR